MRTPTLALSLLLCAGLAPLAARAPETASAQAGPFNPAADSFKDLEAAKAEARASGRRIILDVGGNWCPWCHRLHTFWDAQKDLKDQRDKGFVFVLVNFSKDNKNEAFLAQFPKVPGYPHFFVLDADGKLLQSQDTGILEEGKGYSAEKIAAFLKAWRPA
jgi:thiol:disulfide interchange protein